MIQKLKKGAKRLRKAFRETRVSAANVVTSVGVATMSAAMATDPADVAAVGTGALSGVTASIGAGLGIFAAIFAVGVAKKALHTAA